MAIISFLSVILASLLMPDEAESLTCKCMSAGFDPRFSTYLNGEMPATAPYTGLCTANMTCVAPANSGCFSVKVNQAFYAFCGQTGWLPQVQGVQTILSGYFPTLSQTSSCSNLASQSNVACYCDDRNYCNVPPQVAIMFAGASLPQSVGLVPVLALLLGKLFF